MGLWWLYDPWLSMPLYDVSNTQHYMNSHMCKYMHTHIYTSRLDEGYDMNI